MKYIYIYIYIYTEIKIVKWRIEYIFKGKKLKFI